MAATSKRADWVKVGVEAHRERAFLIIRSRLAQHGGKSAPSELGSRLGLSADFRKTSANLVSRIALIAADHATYRLIIKVDFDSARTLEAWILNDAAGAIDELMRRYADDPDGCGGPRETKRRWAAAKSELSTVVVRGWQRRKGLEEADPWNLDARLKAALSKALNGDLSDLDGLWNMFCDLDLASIFLDSLACRLAGGLRARVQLSPPVIGFLCDLAKASPSIFAVAETGVSRGLGSAQAGFAEIAAIHRTAPGARDYLIAVRQQPGAKDCAPFPSRGRPVQEGLRNFRLAGISAARLFHQGWGPVVKPLTSSSSDSLTKRGGSP